MSLRVSKNNKNNRPCKKILQRNERMSQMLELISLIIKTKSTHPVPHITYSNVFPLIYNNEIKIKSIENAIQNAIANQLQKSIAN